MKLRVLIACEFSGIVREAFRKRGHDAWSCDLLPTEIPGQHIQEDVKTVLGRSKWDMLIASPRVHICATVESNICIRMAGKKTAGMNFDGIR